MLRRCGRNAVCVLPSTSAATQTRCFFNIFNPSKLPKIEFYSIRRRLAEITSNKFKPERVTVLGPDLSCLEWLMECGSTSVTMSDGTTITRIREMKDFIGSHGFDLARLPKPQQILPPLTAREMISESLLNQRWQHVPQVFVVDVDGSDGALSDEGFQYFSECRRLRRLKLNHCDYFTDHALRSLAMGIPALTLQDLEVCLNPSLSDAMVYSLTKMKALKRLHFYFLPYVANRPAVLRQLKMSLPKCRVTFPETDKIGYGYE